MATPTTVKPSQSQVKPTMTPLSGVPVMGLAEAAAACGVSVSTIRRRRGELKELGAAETARGWQIPVTALIALGLMERTTPPPSPDTHPDALKGELEALRAKLADAERRAAIAEAVATERERVIQTQAMALRMLEASKTPADTPPAPVGTPADTPAPPQVATPVSPAPAPRHRWWHRPVSGAVNVKERLKTLSGGMGPSAGR